MPASSTSPAPDDLLALDRQVCFALVTAARDVVALYREVLEPLGLTHPQYLVMLALWEESPQSVSSLGRRLSLEPATLSPLLRRLEAAGLLERKRNPEDERALAVELTTAGRELRQRALDVPPTIMARLGIAQDDLVAVRDTLLGLGRAARMGLVPA
ncbi:MarR family winged helix-turn-helix transcriptional regulator [Pseudolysinimonas sp.]|uniref:MarR family winged helix-turn-helix transcriptional regulator n=1 Tax=Pseudolysinimonas sp. TaxID=2680009 RepID=UPI003F8043F6